MWSVGRVVHVDINTTVFSLLKPPNYQFVPFNGNASDYQCVIFGNTTGNCSFPHPCCRIWHRYTPAADQKVNANDQCVMNSHLLTELCYMLLCVP